MATPPDTEPVPEWVDEDPEIELTMEMDRDEMDEALEFDEFSEEVEVGAKANVDSSGNNSRDDVPLWRLIEMSQEDRSLKIELADFEDYDDFESYAGGLSH